MLRSLNEERLGGSARCAPRSSGRVGAGDSKRSTDNEVDLVVLEYMAAGDVESAFALMFARRPGGPWQPIYGWRREEETYNFVYGAVEGFVAGADALVRLSVSSRDFPPREAILDLDARTLRVVP